MWAFVTPQNHKGWSGIFVTYVSTDPCLKCRNNKEILLGLEDLKVDVKNIGMTIVAEILILKKTPLSKRLYNI